MKRAIGKCGSCGGIVSVPHIWHGVNRPPATCESCGRTADTAAHLPTLPMKPRPATVGHLQRETYTGGALGVDLEDKWFKLSMSKCPTFSLRLR